MQCYDRRNNELKRREMERKNSLVSGRSLDSQLAHVYSVLFYESKVHFEVQISNEITYSPLVQQCKLQNFMASRPKLQYTRKNPSGLCQLLWRGCVPRCYPGSTPGVDPRSQGVIPRRFKRKKIVTDGQTEGWTDLTAKIMIQILVNERQNILKS